MSQLDSYEVDPVFGCHLWLGKVGSNGRPIVWLGRKPINAYKLAYERAVGPVPDGLYLDHLCRREKLCIAPHHLEPVTKRENEMRKQWRYRAAMKRCPRGHSMEGALVTPELGRLCRACHLEQGVGVSQ